MKKVIDADRMVCLEEFNETQTEQIKEKYESMGKWNDVAIDCGGDLILWEDE